MTGVSDDKDRGVSPGGAAVASQGREPLDQAGERLRAPEGRQKPDRWPQSPLRGSADRGSVGPRD
jgi:hypothetical protein